MPERGPQIKKRPNQIEPLVKDSKIKNISAWVGKRLKALAFIGTAVAAHAIIPAALEIKETYVQHHQIHPEDEKAKEERAKKEIMDSQRERIDVRKANRIMRTNERKKFEEKILREGSRNDTYQKITAEKEYVEEGIEQELIDFGDKNFENFLKVLEKEKPAISTSEFLQKVKETLIPLNSGNDTASVAYEALALNLDGGTINCASAVKILAMGLDRLYPGRKNSIFVQRFKGHRRALYQIGEDKFIMDPNCPVVKFPDDKSEQERSQIMTYEDLLKLEAGEKEENLKSLFYYGPPPQEGIPDDSLSDQLIPPVGSKEPLGIFMRSKRTAEDHLVAAEATRAKNKKLKELLKPMEIELRPTVLTVEDARKLVESRLNEFYLYEKFENAEVAKILAQTFPNETLNLPHLQSLTVQEAEALSTFGKLESQGARDEMSEPSAQGQEQAAGTAVVSGRTLRSLKLPGLSTLEPAVAEKLVAFEGESLELGITSLTPEIARILAKFRGEEISLNGIKNLDAATAKELSKFKGYDLYLNGIEDLDAATAGELVQFGAGRHNGFSNIFLNGLKTLDQPVARKLSQFNGSSLRLNGIERLDSSAAYELANINADYLTLDGLKNIDGKTIRALGKFKGLLSLNGLETLDSDSAGEFSHVNWEGIFLDGLKNVDAAMLRELSQYQGEGLSLNGLEELDPALAREFSQFKVKELYLENVKNLDFATAQELIKFKGETIHLPFRIPLDYETWKILKDSGKFNLRFDDFPWANKAP